MRRSAPGYGSIAFGPGPLSQAMKLLIGANVAMFVLTELLGRALQLTFLPATLSLHPASVLPLELWRLVTYMFLHGDPLHLLFNMLALWMFGTELERIWGTRFFLRYYFATGVGAGLLTVLFSYMPFAVAQQLYYADVIGASGAIYGLLLAYALYFPDRQILMFMVFPIAVKYAVIIMGAMAFYSSLTDNSGVASATHLGGLLVGYLMLKGSRLRPLSEAKYWYLRWKMNRVRKKFDVYQGGRSGGGGWDKRVH